MLKEIPQATPIIGYEKVCYNNKIMYKPIYEEYKKGTILIDIESKRLFYVINKDTVIDVDGTEYYPNYGTLTKASKEDITKFWEILFRKGYTITNGVYTPFLYYPMYTLDFGFIPSMCTKGDNAYERFSQWNEVFKTKEECIKWCNFLNLQFMRGYPMQ